MGKINVLSFAVANLIAAGEVVDRPASVIKELMENAIDSGADRITVEIQNGGVTFMRVSDNGCGMSPEDLPIAIRRHATSKIREAEDLESIFTLGFRGEALAAIASVSDLRIISKTADAELGAVLEAHGGEQITVTERGCSTGTSVIVENLFANVPARRKFLKKDVTETMAVTANVEKVALSNPQIAFSLIVDGNLRLETAGDGNLKNTVHALYGKEFASRLIEVRGENEGIEVHGFIGRTDNVKANRNYQNFFVNGRFVKSKTAMAALEQAYTSYLPPEKFPCCVLYLDINPTRVDVNVHPAKLEVKFSNEKAVFEAVYYTVRSALESNVTRPVMSLDAHLKGGRSGARLSDATMPVEEKKQSPITRRQLSYDLEGRTQPQPQSRITSEQYREMVLGRGYTLTQKHELKYDIPDGRIPLTDPPRAAGSPKSAEPPKPVEVPKREDPPKIEQSSKTEEPPKIERSSKTEDFPKIEQPQKTEAPPKTEPPAEEAPPAASLQYRIVGSVFHSYVIVELAEKMLLIDQHAAHERILFEQLKAGMQNAEPTSQMLMLPVEVMMTTAEVESLRQYEEELSRIGFALRYARNTVFADAIPEGVTTAAVGDMLQTMAGRILDNTGSVKLTRDIIFEKALYQAACKAAIKAGREYAEGHIEWLVKRLMEIPDITFCPHGRPVAMELTKHTLDRQFDRLGF